MRRRVSARSIEVKATEMDSLTAQIGSDLVASRRVRSLNVSCRTVELDEIGDDFAPMRPTAACMARLDQPLVKPEASLAATIHLQLPERADSLCSRNTRAMRTREIGTNDAGDRADEV